MKWHKKDINAEEVRTIASRFGLDLLTSAILVRRGLTSPEKLRFYLEKDLRFLHNPFYFTEMEDVVERINTAAEEGQKVKIFGDRDADGIISTVLLVRALEKLGIEASWSLPQGDDAYGLSMEGVEEFADQGGNLLITVDCGISNNREIRCAASRGIDSLIFDHHNPQEEIPPAYAILNPKMEDSGYPFPGLAGCGVAAKVVWALGFSQTEFYNQGVTLMNIVPGNDSYVLEALKLVNLVETDRLRETLIPGMVEIENTRLGEFLKGRIVVYDEKPQVNYLKHIFGRNIEIGVIDLSLEIMKYFPTLEGKSLLRMKEESRLALYREKTMGELEVLVNLFTSYVFKKQENFLEDYREELDLVALGTLADLMPLQDENRILVKQGMRTLNGRKRLPLAEVCSRQKLGGKTLSTTDVGWHITPVINATGRMGVPNKAAELFLAQDPRQMRTLADEVVNLNKERKKLGEKAWDRVLPMARTSCQEFESKLVMVADRELRRGITGIIASRLTKLFHTPAIALSLMKDKAVGSMRCSNNFNAKDFLGQMADFFLDYGGHDCAAGFSLEISLLEPFKKRLAELVGTMKPPPAVEETLEIDAELPRGHMTPKLVDVVERLAPYGEGYPPVLFLAHDLVIEDVTVMGRGEIRHLRLLLDSGDYKWPAVYWRAADRLARDFSKKDAVDLVFRLNRNYFQNKESLELTVMDLKRCEK